MGYDFFLLLTLKVLTTVRVERIRETTLKVEQKVRRKFNNLKQYIVWV